MKVDIGDPFSHGYRVQEYSGVPSPVKARLFTLLVALDTSATFHNDEGPVCTSRPGLTTVNHEAIRYNRNSFDTITP